MEQKVAIIGAGMSGLYAAWRLIDSGVITDASNITVYDKSSIVGGRLLTISGEGLFTGNPETSLDSDDGHCDIGGMRIPYSRDIPKEGGDGNYAGFNNYAYELANHLKLVPTYFQTENDSNWHYLRGKAMKTEQLKESASYPTVVPYGINGGEASIIESGITGISKTAGLGNPIVQALTSNSIISADSVNNLLDGTVNIFDFVTNALSGTVPFPSGSVPLSNIGLSDLLVLDGEYQGVYAWNLSNEYWRLFSDAGGYDTIPSSWNAAVACPIMVADFAGQFDYCTLSEGYASLPQALSDAFKEKGGNLQLSTSVTSLSYDGDNVQLYNELEPLGKYDSVIMALPPAAAMKLMNRSIADEWDGPFSNWYNEIKAAVTPIPLLKIYLMYEDGDWFTESAMNVPKYTRMTTDLPLRQIYYFGEYVKDGKNYRIFQISYDDDLNPGYWAGLMDQNTDTSSGPFGGLFSNDDSTFADFKVLNADTYDDLLKEASVFAVAHQQFLNFISKTSGGTAPGLPIAGGIADWAGGGYGGGVNYWNIGQNIEKQYFSLMTPPSDNSMPIYLVGEGLSLFQGWVEGALWTAEAVLNKYYGVPKSSSPDRPTDSWVPPFDVDSLSS